MVTVDPADQHRLLQVQALDTRLDQVAHSREQLPEAARARELEALVATLRDDVVLLQTKVSDLDREVTRAENDVQSVRSRSERDRSRLEAGTGSSKDLLATQHELESLARRQSDLEDVELEVMERREEQQELLSATQARLDAARAELQAVVDVRDTRFAEIDSQHEALTDDRRAAATGLAEPMMKVYDRLRGRLGSGAAALTEGRCDGCRMPLSPSDVHVLMARPADEMVRCPECERVLVRPAATGA